MPIIILSFIIIQNLVTPLILIGGWIKVEVNAYKRALKINERNYTNIFKNTQPPPDAESKYPKAMYQFLTEEMDKIRINAWEEKESSIRADYSDFTYWLHLGESIQILISVINVAIYYVFLPLVISLAIFFQSIDSSIISVIILEIKHIYYPKEIKYI